MSSPNIGDAISGIAMILKAEVLPDASEETRFEVAKISMSLALGFAAEHAALHSPECLQDCLTFLAKQASRSECVAPASVCEHEYTDVLTWDGMAWERCRSCGIDIPIRNYRDES